ncbi:MAG: sigma-70 family RNA polymerase sigma factor [Lentisphaeraceae bacterium]|nr:sigma-70 family RNA polymerase sigma factor [Lentisphaeraceae bacterium]
MDETRLIIETQEGSIEAYEELMHIYMHRIRAFLAMRAPVPSIIDQIANDTFIYAYNHIDEFEADTYFFRWLTAIARNLLRAEVQRFARVQSNKDRYAIHLQSMNELDETEDEAEVYVDHLKVCVQNLPKNQKDLIQMKYHGKLSTNDLADSWNKSTAWVRTTIFRIRKELKKCIEAKVAVESNEY